MLDPGLTVSEVLHVHPQAERAFFQLGTDCVGCYLMSFCSLREVADQYALPLEQLLDALSKAVQDEIEKPSHSGPISDRNQDTVISKGENYELSC